MMCCIDCTDTLSQSHTGVSVYFHRNIFSPQHPCPVLNLFSLFHSFQGNCRPGTASVGSPMIDLFSKFGYSSHFCRHRSVIEKSSDWISGSFHIGCLDVRRCGGGFVKSYTIGNFSASRWFISWNQILCAAASRRRACGAIFDSTGSHGNGVDWTDAVIILLVSFSWQSILSTWALLYHTGAAYSADE